MNHGTFARRARLVGLAALAVVGVRLGAGCVGGEPGGASDTGVSRVTSAVTFTSGGAQVNAGSTSAVAPFIADANYSGGGTVTRNNTIDLTHAANPAPAAVYQSQRYGDFTYTFGGFAASSLADIRFHFCDTHWTTPGQRIFNVYINGTQVLFNLDVVAAIGAGNRAYVLKLTNLQANLSGQYVIQFTTVKDAATVSGIEVFPKATWSQYGGDSTHSSNNKIENQIGTWNVSRLVQQFSVPGSTQPLVGTDLIYTISTNETAPTGETVPMIVAYGAKGGNVAFKTNPSKSPFMGNKALTFLATPALDLTGSIYAAQKDGYIHRYNASTGGEITFNWGAGISTAQFSKKPANEPSTTSLTISDQNAASTPYLYLGVGNCDSGGNTMDCQGHVMALTLGAGTFNAFNLMCPSANPNLIDVNGCGHNGGAIWNRGGVVYDPVVKRLLVKAANAILPADNLSGGFLVNSVLSLDYQAIGSAGKPLDSFTPTSIPEDIGGSSLTVLDNVAGVPSGYSHLAMVTGNIDGTLRLINLDNMSGQGAPGKQGGEIATYKVTDLTSGTLFNSTATWVNPADGTTWFFIPMQAGIGAGDGAGIMYAFKINPKDAANQNRPSMAFQWKRACNTGRCSGPVVANGVLYYDDGQDLLAVTPTTGNVSGSTVQAPLWCSAGINGTHCNNGIKSTYWKPAPVVANGFLYYATRENTLTAFAPPQF
ncbi:MAG TPA: malectin domain-containing carbohydrate-binding protein [Polyangia bacterium]|nr:malectin domain-containing carbohydrate-binding protein [Polyangia bacterium]